MTMARAGESLQTFRKNRNLARLDLDSNKAALGRFVFLGCSSFPPWRNVPSAPPSPFRIEVDPSLPEDTIEFHHGQRVIGRIINIKKGETMTEAGDTVQEKDVHKMKTHEHTWFFSHKTCCYILNCSFPGCGRLTRAYSIKGERPLPGEPVRFLDDQETIEKIGSRIEV